MPTSLVKGVSFVYRHYVSMILLMLLYRLKQTLALPKIEPRPPCPPKIYQKLYRYLDTALPTGARRSSRPPRHKNQAATTTSSPAKPRTPVRPTAGPRRKTPSGLASSSEVPAWVMPVIRQLCKKLGAPAAPHHIFAGVSSILSSQDLNRKTSTQKVHVKIPALIIIVFLLVTTRLAGVATPPTEYLRRKDLALAILKEEATEAEETQNVDVDACMREVKDQHWLEMDWFENIQVGAGVGIDDGEEDEDSASDDEEAGEGQFLPGIKRGSWNPDLSDGDYLQAGLGTMMQDRVDYLSPERRRDYQEWKTDMLLQIAELEKEQDQEMDRGDG